jgi:hypothetical protein
MDPGVPARTGAASYLAATVGVGGVGAVIHAQGIARAEAPSASRAAAVPSSARDSYPSSGRGARKTGGTAIRTIAPGRWSFCFEGRRRTAPPEGEPPGETR